MGSHASYPLIIENLVSLKSQFQFITEEKFQGVLKELSEYEVVIGKQKWFFVKFGDPLTGI